MALEQKTGTRKSGMDAAAEAPHEPAIIAVTGKGGVGKTSLSAAMVRLLAQENPGARILAIDADPAMGLSTALDVEVTRTLDDIRRSVMQHAQKGRTQGAVDVLAEARYEILDTLVEKEDFTFLAIGRPETAGCYCAINTYLKAVIGLLAKEFDHVVIDGEAGIEQVNRRVLERVSHLVMVTDQSRKGIHVINTIRRVANELVVADRFGVVVNRALDPALTESLDFGDLSVSVVIPEDPAHARNEVLGNSVFTLPDGSPLLAGARSMLDAFGLLGENPAGMRS